MSATKYSEKEVEENWEYLKDLIQRELKSTCTVLTGDFNTVVDEGQCGNQQKNMRLEDKPNRAEIS